MKGDIQKQQLDGQRSSHGDLLAEERSDIRRNSLQGADASEGSRSKEAFKQLFCGGVAGMVAKTVTAPLSRLTILFQVHSLVTTKETRPRFAMSLKGGVEKIVERGGFFALWKGNLPSVLHRFPYSAINFFVYENTMDYLSGRKARMEHDETELSPLVRRVTKTLMFSDDGDEENDGGSNPTEDGTPTTHKFLAGALAGTVACSACYPLDLVRTRMTTQLEGRENYRGMFDAFGKIYRYEGLLGFYSGLFPTMLVAVPSFAISFTVYGTLKEYTLDDELFYNLRKIDANSGEPKLGFLLTVMCGAASGTLATLITFPMDTIRRRMQVQNLHVPEAERLSSLQQFNKLVHKEGLKSLYRGLTPELLKVIPMVGTMFVVYEKTKEMLNVSHDRK